MMFRIYGGHEVANNTSVRSTLEHLFQTFDRSSVASTVVTPFWFPSPARIRKTWAGLRMYLILNRIAKAKTKEASPLKDDPTHYNLALDDSTDRATRFAMVAVMTG